MCLEGYRLDSKSLGKRRALNAHAAFDVVGAGNTILRIGAPVLDPTLERLGLVPLPTRPPLLSQEIVSSQSSPPLYS